MRLIRKLCYLFLFKAITLVGQLNTTISSSTGAFSLTCTHPTIVLTATSNYTGGAVNFTWSTPQFSVISGNSVTATVPGIYTVTALSGTISESNTVSVANNLSIPTLTLTSSSTSITCLTYTTLMTAISNPTNVSYSWIEPGVGFPCTTYTCVFTVPGVYGVTVKDLANGCTQNATVSLQDGRNYPIFDPVGVYTVACPNGTANLEPSLSTGTANVSFQWKIPPGAITSTTNSSILTTNTPGEYTVTVTNSLNGCSTNAFILVYACVGIKEINYEADILVYPNPANKVLNIELKEASSRIINFQIINSIGQIVKEEDVDLKENTSIKVNDLQEGIYILNLHIDKENITKRFVVER
jgi:hypothetical protein